MKEQKTRFGTKKFRFICTIWLKITITRCGSSTWITRRARRSNVPDFKFIQSKGKLFYEK